MKWLVVIIIFLKCIMHATCAWGQFFSSGEPPASVHWSNISTTHFNIVFPAGLTDDANKLANTLEYYFPFSKSDLELSMKKRFPVLLHSTSVLSNGYVTLAPKRMELVTTPPQDSYAQDWITQLTLHEFRHVAQLNQLNQGFTAALGWFTGEIATGGVSSQMPSWFYEGDAVINETRLSESGRGRIPGFEMPLRTLLLERPYIYSYDKAILGSYRDFIPDHYQYGYQMVSYARSRFGNEVWSQALDYTARHPFLIYPLVFYLKKNYGIFKTGLYIQTMDSLKKQYNKQKEIITYSDYTSQNIRRSVAFTSYILPKDMGNGRTLAKRTGLDYPGSFIIIDSMGMVKQLFITGKSMDLKSDLFENQLIWDEVVSDPRWARRDYSEIRVADLKTGKQSSLTHKSRYFSPDFSPDGKRISVVETDNQNRHYITILDAHNGKRMQQIPSPENRALQFPIWISDIEILTITTSDKGKQLEICNIENETWTIKLPFTKFNIAEPLNYENYILFRSSFNGIENIYAVSKKNSDVLYQVTFSRYGAYNPTTTIDMQNLLFSNYGPSGFDIVNIPLDSSSWKRIIPLSAPQTRWTNPITVNNTEMPSQDSVLRINYKIKPYNKLAHLFNFHSWLPFCTNLEDFTGNLTEIPITPGIMLYSQNLLSTVISSIGYTYNQGYHELIPSIRWRAWYPVIELSGRIGGHQSTLPLPEGIALPDNAATYHEINLKGYIPLVYNRGKYITLVQPLLEYQHTNTWYYSGGELMKGIDFLHYKLSVNHYLRFSQRDLYPKWGQFISATYTQSPSDNRQFGNLFSVQAVTFFPGVFAHHHFYIRGGLQVQRPEEYFIPINRIDFPRGYNTAVSGKFASLIFNYSFPAGYPDLAIGPLLYLKRFRVNLFHDWSYGSEIKEHNASGVVDYSGAYRSFGTEILADMHILRVIFPVTAGIRLGYIPGKQKFFSEFMLSMQTGIF
jgi:Tol biopolymer transport system component